MNNISKNIEVAIPAAIAFQKFVGEFNSWWPKEYTWSQDNLREIRIDGQEGGLCTEIGPHGFHCDWGRVTEYIASKKIGLKWQISPRREPVPNPDQASDISVSFNDEGNSTTVMFEHGNFANHGEGAADYQKMMDSEQGWGYILECFRQYCESD